MHIEPIQIQEHPVWEGREGPFEVRFVGRGPIAAIEELVRVVAGPGPALAHLKQIHSGRVRSARPGRCGEGDALVTLERDLVCCVVTADCVPILLTGPRAVAAVHAGWRGLVAGVVGAAVEAMPSPPALVTAWIGPAIGACCYEVGTEVADRVSEASGSPPLRPNGSSRRPHLDLVDASRRLLEDSGVRRIRTVESCTRCSPQLLHSYRRDGSGEGRNLALVWRPSV